METVYMWVYGGTVMRAESGVQSSIMNIKASGKWQFGFTTEVKLDHLEAVEAQTISEQPVPSGVDLAVAALVGCTCVAMSQVAREMDFYHNGIDFSGEAEFTVDNLSQEEGPVRLFKSIQATVVVRTDENDERLSQLAQEVQNRCQVFGILKDAGLAPNIQWKRAA
jgi:uncharacterized OsmC-like protein